MVDEVFLLQMSQVAAARAEGLALTVAQVFGVGHAEGANSRQRAHLGAPQQHALLVDPHALALWATRQVEVTREHVPRISPVAVERVGCRAATALVQFAAGFCPTRIVSFIRPTGIEVHKASFKAHARAEFVGGAGRGRPARRAGATPVTSALGAEDGWGCPATGPANWSSALGDGDSTCRASTLVARSRAEPLLTHFADKPLRVHHLGAIGV